MAAEGETETADRAHRSSYGLFVALMKYGALISFIVALLVVVIIRA